MQDILKNLLLPSQYIPHGHCYLWQSPLVGVHLVSDLLIALAYFSIPIVLLYFVHQRSSTPFPRVLLLFGAFILLCGLGHVLDVWTLWQPIYWISGIEKAVTALVSCYTALKLIELFPQFLALRPAQELETVNEELQALVTQLQQEQEFTHVVVENVSDGVVACDAEGRLKLFNRAARDWHGCDPREVSPELWASLYNLYEADGVTPLSMERIPLLRAFSGESVRQAGMAIVVRDQEPRYVLASGDPLFDADGQKIGAVVAMHDITKQRQAEEALRKSEFQLRQQAVDLEQTLQDLQHTQAQLIQSEKMSSLGQLVAGVAHEINNPVNFIYGNLCHAREYTQDLLGLVNLYKRHYPDPALEIEQEIEAIDLGFLVNDLPKLLNSMEVGADRIQKIVTSLRIFSRMDEAECKPVNLHDGIDSTLMILQNRLKSKGDRPDIQVIKHYGNLPLVECYAGQLNQVFMNILSNAIDALEEAFTKPTHVHRNASADLRATPTIEIRTERVETGHISISIADNGSGIPGDIQQRLFDPFFTTKPIGKGTGMGLSISYQIVTERHRGRLQCLSTVGQGATFLIEIPISQSHLSVNSSEPSRVKLQG